MGGRCRACGSWTRIDADGVCVWRAGCEHRQLRAEAAAARIDAEMTPLACGHTTLEHRVLLDERRA